MSQDQNQEHEPSEPDPELTSEISSPENDDRMEIDAENATHDELAVELQRLVQENQRLRQEYARAKQVTYRKTALGLFTAGSIAIIGAMLFPTSETVLLTLGGIGIFGGLLTYYFTPERVVPESVGGSVYQAHMTTGVAMVDELGLTDHTIYVPVDRDERADSDGNGETDHAPKGGAVRLFCPQSANYELPSSDALTQLFVASDESDDQRGVAVTPTGAAMFDEFEYALTGELASTPEALATQLSDALIEQFELARGTTIEVDSDQHRVSVGVSGCIYGDGTQFDHPVASVLGTGFAHGIGRPIQVEALQPDRDDVDVIITCRWDGEREREE